MVIDDLRKVSSTNMQFISLAIEMPHSVKDIHNGQVASAGHPGHLLGTSRQGARLLHLSEMPGEPSVNFGIFIVKFERK